MDDHEKNESAANSPVDKITEKFHGSDSSSSDSDDDNDIKSAATAVKSKIYRLFGREKPVHKVLGGGRRTALYSESVWLFLITLIYTYIFGYKMFDLFW